jgi:signal transduction histidine kinase
MKKSLLNRLVLNQLFVVVLFAVLTTTNVLWQLYREGEGEYDQHMLGTAQVLLQAVEPSRDRPEVMLHDMALLADSIRSIIAMEKKKARLSESKYELVVRFVDRSGATLFQTPAHIRLPANSAQLEQTSFEWDQRQWRSRSLKNASGDLTLQLAETENGVDGDAADVILRFIVIPTILFLPIAGLLTWLAARRGLSPLRDLAQLISRRTPNELQALGPVARYAETAPVVQEINGLMARLRDTLAREREFLADAAHELRTPLAVVQAQAHVLRHAIDEPAKNKAALELDMGVGRAAALIRKLLLSARVSGEDFAPQLQEIELNALVQERVALLSTLAARKQIEMSLVATSRVKVRVDRESFASAVDNVVDNAIRYTPAGGNIEIEIVRSNDAWVRLRVADNGVGIPGELHERVFERFFRVNNNEQVGSGLGLAIVKRVLHLHGGEVSLSTGLDQRGLAVAMTLPGAG